MPDRFVIVESHAYATIGQYGRFIDTDRTDERTVGRSRVATLVRELRQDASGYADRVVDSTDADGVRTVAAHHWNCGVENRRTLTIRKAV